MQRLAIPLCSVLRPLLAATCEDIDEALRQRTIREDLYYRLSVVPLTLPALRERAEDIPLLVQHFLSASTARFGRQPSRLSPDALERMLSYHWPGNVRELANCVERMVVLGGTHLGLDDLPPSVLNDPEGQPNGAGLDLPPGGVSISDLERRLIRQALERTQGALGPAAKLLGLSYKTLQYRIKKHGLEKGSCSARRSS